MIYIEICGIHNGDRYKNVNCERYKFLYNIFLRKTCPLNYKLKLKVYWIQNLFNEIMKTVHTIFMKDVDGFLEMWTDMFKNNVISFLLFS